MIIAGAVFFPATLFSAEKTADQVMERAAEKIAEKAEQVATEEAELIARRPGEQRGPTKVYFSIFVIDIDDIDEANQSFTANIYVRLRWMDERLVSPDDPARRLRLGRAWNPRIVLVNLQGPLFKSMPDVVNVSPDGSVIYHQRYTVQLSQPLNLYEFPRDTHSFTIHFAAADYTNDELKFLPDLHRSVKGGSISDTLSLPDWKVVSHDALALSYSPIDEVDTPGFAFRFVAERYVNYYIWQVILPLMVVVVMSWAAFWVGKENVSIRIGVATSSILTLIAQRFVFASLLPRLPYMTRLDFFTVGSTLLVFVALMLVILTSFLVREEHDTLVHKIDNAARVTFPLIFLAMIGWFFYG